ncbi:MAG: UDP-N-acetylmuramoyl-tripeptide--D-alanyl-D-alanine ligase [Deltaproteobacteria bacterium]|jgi:UDP-N-acetylmuramoyl-tripeptide--D-alanyl-D-alanine ligase|nr:UDP-N-acetylmuramoyl-tripeptide--D-alanyl-D-alanine ligase [Deltaproteobacteria bacterium]
MSGTELKSGPGLAQLGLSLKELAQMAQLTGAEGLKNSQLKVKAVSTDSRLAGPGTLFVALKGPNFDGRDFVSQAIAKGALAAVVEKGEELKVDKSLIIETSCSLEALGLMARAVRDLVKPTVVAVTGSVGKTTVKELLRSIVSLGGQDSLIAAGNFNNQVGLPLTLLGLSPTTRLAVLEMGANRMGEIEALTRTAKPNVGLITAVGRAHLEGFGTVENVAKAKSEILEGLERDDYAVYNSNEELLKPYINNFKGLKMTFGEAGSGADVVLTKAVDLGLMGQRISLIGPGLKKPVSLVLKLHGRHNALNAAAAAAAGLAAGFDWEILTLGLSLAEPVEGRFKPKLSNRGLGIIDDSYNANPTSVAAALRCLAALDPLAPKAAILGDMLELGEEAQNLHIRIGRLAVKIGLDYLALVGPLSHFTAQGAAAAGLNARRLKNFSNPEEAAFWIVETAPKGSLVLVKGSRSVGLEKAVEYFFKINV